MVDLKKLREDPDFYRKATADKQRDPKLVDKVLEFDSERREVLQKVEQLRAERNKLGKEGIERGKQIKTELDALEKQLAEIDTNMQEVLLQIPNPALSIVPVGKDESGNVVVKSWGKPKKPDFPIKDHLELGKTLDILDFEAGAKTTGSQFYFLYNEGALLELSLVHFAMDLLRKEGFIPVITPDLAKSRCYLGTGYLPQGEEAQTYEIKDEDLGLIATAEVTLAGKHADEVIPEEKLPLKYIGYSHCFRKEAGSYGKYSKGLYRVHEFTKAEIFIYCTPEESEKMHELILAMEEKIYQALELPYRVAEMCTGDLGGMAARKFDIEAWMPGRKEYGEVTSTSNCTDYQARNLNIRLKRKSGELEFVHMLNGTAIATSRTSLAILENYQQADGSVLIPSVLQNYTGFAKISPKK